MKEEGGGGATEEKRRGRGEKKMDDKEKIGMKEKSSTSGHSNDGNISRVQHAINSKRRRVHGHIKRALSRVVGVRA